VFLPIFFKLKFNKPSILFFKNYWFVHVYEIIIRYTIKDIKIFLISYVFPVNYFHVHTSILLMSTGNDYNKYIFFYIYVRQQLTYKI